MKKTINKKIKIIGSYLSTIIMALSFTFFSCETPIEELFRDCIENPKPKLPDRDLKIGNLGAVYNDELIAFLMDRPNFDGYNYDFKIDGSLPEGIEVNISHRTLFFEGVPKQTGTYNFTIHVKVDVSSDTTDFCNNNKSSKEYTLVIY